MTRLSQAAAALLLAMASMFLPATFLPATAAAHDGKLTFAPVLKKVTPAVVNIETAGTRRTFSWPSGRTLRSRGSGAGVVIDADAGHVVTNHHVIADADEITVVLEDRRTFEAELVGSDAATDIALLRIDADGLQALALGDSEQLAVGDFVVAVGNPFELGHTVTSGIVSALGRGGFSRQGYEDFIQTDAAINRGNSGGPLVDLDGQLVGINSSIITPSGANAGVGFAVPSNIVQVVTSQILEHGEVRRGKLGVMIANLRPEDSEALGLESVNGALVSEVMSGTAAEDAGIEPGDVIVGLDGKEVVDSRDLRTRIALAPIGDEVDIDVVRDGKRKTLEAVIGALESARESGGAVPLLAGAQWRNLSRSHELYGSLEGVELAEVAPESPAWDAGLRSGDVIVRVNRRPVTSVQELEEALAESQVAGLLVQRGERRLFALVR